MQKYVGVLALFLAFSLLASCGGAAVSPSLEPSPPPTPVPTPTPSPAEPSVEEEIPVMTVFEPSADNVKQLGRTSLTDGVLWCAHSGTGAEFTVTGSSASVTLLGDNAAGTDNQARIAILLDGERVIDEMLDAREKVIPIFEGDAEREVVVTIVKLSESAMSTVGIGGIEVTGSIAPTPQKPKLIEFVGDSITCGYGVDDEDRNHHFSTSTEDVTKTYAYLAAAELGADYSMVSFSGYGVISGYTSAGVLNEAQTVPKYYEKLGFSYGDGFPAAQTDWDFSKREPDMIVVNLGTNDDSYCGGDADRAAEYTAGYIEFLKQIRAKNPGARIVCSLGIMGDRLYAAMEAAVAGYTAETGDINVETLKFPVQQASDGYAADWHPTFATHAKAAAVLVSALTFEGV
ncbi:MAG: GDSL-type esterase/lipase family protein [Oscillospiraceae bacterium]|jgi:lysophospholipase L1-like esterase|nr:GDSL-type esterase/lipase family protein [Oscillospiraceae bacterium]